MSANDIRKRENMPPIDGGDVYLVPMNMVPADQLGLSEPIQDGPPAVARSVESRALSQTQVASKRQRLSKAQRLVLTDTIGRIMRREATDVANAFSKLGPGSEFTQWLSSFLDGHRDFIVKQMTPVMLSYAQAVSQLVADELDNLAVMDNDWGPWVDNYLASYAARHVGRSQLQMDQALADDTVTDVLDTWRTSRPAREAANESTRFSNATALAGYVLLGRKTKTWMTLGDSCPYCQTRNGMTIEIGGLFIEAGSQLAPEGHEPMTVNSNIGHCPAHEGCDCVTISGSE